MTDSTAEKKVDIQSLVARDGPLSSLRLGVPGMSEGQWTVRGSEDTKATCPGL